MIIVKHCVVGSQDLLILRLTSNVAINWANGRRRSMQGTKLTGTLQIVVVVWQVPFLFGVTAIEKVASHVIHWIFGRTGRHLFLTDDDEGKPPLLQRMVDDYDDLCFMYFPSLLVFVALAKF